ncbi:MAG: 16S rRNA (guanine(966)-N(2))-methyltransferase RsmD [Bacteroidia bacterium]
MRIVAGRFRGRVIHPPKGLPVRPTTDQAKEALFNILNNRLDFDGLKVLDCFAGTGNMSYEFLSRGVEDLLAIDADAGCVRFIQATFRELGATQAHVLRMNADRYFREAPVPYDLIFMDPPYAMPGQEELISSIFQGGWLAEDGLLILEHASNKPFTGLAEFVEMRKYGGSSFSFFESLK